MKTNVSVYDFRDTFKRSDTYKDNFSYAGLTALYDYLIQLEEDTGVEMDFDMVSLCCDYSEYEDLNELKDEYEIKETDSDEDTLEWFRDRTTVIEMPNGGIIIQQF